jgi:membrane fusion protein, multidrug efflux system
MMEQSPPTASRHKRWVFWLLAALVLAALAAGLVRTLSARQARKQALEQSALAPAQGQIELAATDVIPVQTLELVQGLPVSGTVRAVNSAVVKARVAGELQGLSVREGDFVRAGQVLARIDSSEYQARQRQAREQAESSRAQIDVAQRQYDNNKALVDQGFISKTALDTSLANLTSARSTFNAARAAVDLANKSVEDTVVRSPLAGQVAQRLAQPGERVGIDTRIVEIVDLGRLEIEATLSAADSTQVSVGQKAQLQIEGSGQSLQAQVVRINPSAQAGSRSVLVYLGIDTSAAPAASPLRQGLFVQGMLGTARQARLVVPLGSVRTDKPEPYVQTVENGQVVHRRVTLGARGSAGGESMVEVSGLAEKTPVIRAGIGALREGTPVRFTKLATTPAGLAAPAATGLPAARSL